MLYRRKNLKLAVHIATHLALRSIDHIGELLKAFGKGSCLENLRMHRTKCTKLILNVISPSIVEQLLAMSSIKDIPLLWTNLLTYQYRNIWLTV